MSSQRDKDEGSGLFESFELLFPSVAYVSLETSEGEIGIIGLNEMPISAMAKFMEAPEHKKITFMSDLMQTCLLDPKDWEKIANVSVSEFTELIAQWMQKSHDEG